MKRKIFYSIASAVVLVFVLFACHKENEDVPVQSVSLNITADTLDVNGTLSLVAAIEPEYAFNQYVRWTSSNGTVAMVDGEGIVTALAPGTATIIVTTEDGGFTATCTITVIMQVSNITLNKKALALVIGGTEKLIATIVPVDASNKTVAWTSSNNAVATVDNSGFVTAISEGTATIRAATQDETKYDECEVTVSNPNIPVQGLILNKSSLTLTEGGAAETLIATVLPANATNKTINWISSKPSVATVSSNGTVAPVAIGSATIIATTVDGGKTAICNVTVESPDVPVSSVGLPAILTIDGSETKTLTATILPSFATNTKVIWTNSDETVATISGTGLTIDITPVAPAIGDIALRSTTVTVTTEDGSFTASCEVIVRYIAVTEVVVAPGTVSKKVSESETLTVTVLPANASIKTVTWESDNTSAVKVFSNGVITAMDTGSATITATSVSENTILGSCEVTVTN